MNILIYAATIIGAYLFGSISPAIIISNTLARKDVRNYGSGNAGATNMLRTFGVGMGMLTFLLDIIKGAIVALLCEYVLRPIVGDTEGVLTMLGCFAVILGHSYPIYYKFRGGKGVSSTLGVFLVLMTTPTLGALALSFVSIAISGMVSVGSILGMIICSVLSVVLPNNIYVMITVIVLSCFTIFLHRENIVRIFTGKERKISLKKHEHKTA